MPFSGPSCTVNLGYGAVVLQIAYGTTENSPVTFQSSVHDSLEKRAYTVGSALPHVEVYQLAPTHLFSFFFYFFYAFTTVHHAFMSSVRLCVCICVAIVASFRDISPVCVDGLSSNVCWRSSLEQRRAVDFFSFLVVKTK